VHVHSKNNSLDEHDLIMPPIFHLNKPS